MSLAAAWLFAAAATVVVVFQAALAAGAPWGEYAMGGRVKGRLPASMRVAAVVQALVVGLLAVVVLDCAGAVELGWEAAIPWLAWVPVVVSGLTVAMNAASRSRGERRLWVPVGLVMLLSSLVVAAA